LTTPWWDRHPGRLEWEQEQFWARGLTLATEICTDRGLVVLRTELAFRGEQVEIRIELGPDYPDIPPSVYGPARLIDRHQHPAHGNFCLLEDPEGGDWWPGACAAHLVDEDLRWLLEDTEASPEAVSIAESDLPEPISAYFEYERNATLLVPEPLWQLDLATRNGTLTGSTDQRQTKLRIENAEGLALIDRLPLELGFPALRQSWTGQWAALDSPLPPYPTTTDVLEAVDSRVLTRLLGGGRRNRNSTRVLALTFTEEGPMRGQQRRAWVGVRLAIALGGSVEVTGWVRAQALSQEERLRRIPELHNLSERRILLVGAGSVGAPVAMELAKAGIGHTDIIDHDHYDVNNAVRHTLAVSMSGHNKAEAVAAQALGLNPFVKVTAVPIRLGTELESSRHLADLLEHADLAIDTTGSATVSRLLTRVCSEGDTVLIVAGLSASSHGADLGVFPPGGPCWYCLTLRQEDGSIPRPPEAPRRPATPIGCSHPAFSGPGFEATELAAIVARTAIRALEVTDYPPLDHSWAVINFRGSPRWQQGKLLPHRGCPQIH